VKTNIGHLESAAGVAGVMKVLLGMRHGLLPGNPHLKNPNAYLQLDGTPFYLQRETTEWNTIDGHRRIAGVSSFGFGGANAHVVMEEYRGAAKEVYRSEDPAIIVLSARNGERLKQQAVNLKNYLASHPGAHLHDIAYTLQVGRAAMEERVAIIARNHEELIVQLDHYLQNKATGKYFTGNTRKDQQSIYLKGKAGEAYIREAIRQKEPESLAQLWTGGVSIDWNLLYPHQKPSKLRMPTYPFARERYWIPEMEIQSPKADNSEPQLHPLLHRNESDLEQQVFTSVYTGSEPFLRDHKVQQEKILPGVAYLEIAREAGQRSTRSKVTQIKDISWLSPIRVNGTPEKVHISLYPVGEEVSYEVYTGEEQVHSQGRLSTKALATPSRQDISAIRHRLTSSKPGPECYALFKEKGLDYGSSFQGIETLYYSKEEALSRIHLPAQEGYVLTPGVLDSALQTCAGLSFSGSEQNLALPFSLAELNIYNNLPEALWCHVRRSSSSSGNIMHYNIELLNDEGAVLVQIKEFTLLPIDRLKQHGQENSRTYLYQSLWKEAAVKTTDKADRKQMILIAGGSADLADKLQEELEAEVRAIGAATPEAYLLAVLDEVKKRAQQKAPAHIIVVHQNSEQADYAFASGLLKTVAQEHSFLSGKVLGVEQLSMQHLDELVPLLQTEQHTADAEVRYRSGRREVKTLEEISHINSSTPSSIREGGIYLVTGGAGGLGMILAEHMGRTKDAHVILTGRSELSQQKSQAIAHLNASYYRCDVTSREDVINLMTTIKERHGHLNGIIHSAGVLRDSLLLNKTAEEVQAVVAPKITGWKNLDEATRDEALDFVVLFSSLSSIMGNAGQADYAAANSWLDNYALYRNELVAQGRRSGRTLSINWPLWKDGGMQISEDTQDYLTRQFGLSPLPTQEGIAAFETFLDSTISQGIVLHGKDIRIANKVHREAAPLHDNKPTGNTTELKEKASGKIRELIAELLKLGVSDIETDAELGDYGFDSVLLTKFANSLNEYYDLDIKPTAFYNYTTIEQLAGFLAEDHYEQLAKRHGSTTQEQSALTEAASVQAQPVQKQRTRFMRASQPARQSSSNEPIAIIGISGRFPGSPDLPTFWNNLKENKDLITEVPADRWDWKKYYGDPLTEKNKTKAKWGGFIQDIDKFDPLFFSISPLEAELMDPQQRITLQAVYEAIEDAALSADHIKGSATGIFIGVSASDYTLLVHRHTDLTGEAQFSTGAAHSMLVNRISYLLDLHGPSEPIDTACSSSLVAIHRAVESIRNGHCSMAIAGGVNALLAPDATLSFSQAGMLSEEGRCCTFDQSASGYVRGEGVGVIVLKPLSQAEADGDPIYAVIRSTAENHGGKANTLTSPNPQAQKELLLKAYRSGGVDPRHVGYIEAHGTGTPLGDPIETEGLKLAFKELYRERGLEMPSEPYCALGSVKTNIGHLESAAGVAGVMKVLLGMRHGLLPGNPHLKNPNAYLQLDGTPFYLQRETTPWNTIDGHRRIAGVSSFGFGGANAHVVMEEYRGAAKEVYRSEDPAIIVLSARNGERLKQQAVNLKNYLASHPGAHLHDIAYTLQVGRAAMEERVAIIARNHEELIVQLDHYLQNKATGKYFTGNTRKDQQSIYLKGKAGEAYIREAIRQKEPESLAQLWTGGVSIDWNLLYPHQKPSKLRMPTYPFARERYWIPEMEIQSPKADNSEPQLHPLLHRNESDLEQQVFTSVYTGSEPFLRDHKVQQEKILPGVAYLEIAREAGQRSTRSKVTQIKDISWLSPIRVNGTPEKVHISLYPVGEEVSYEVYTGEEQVHSQGRLSTKALATPSRQDISAIRHRLTSSKPGPECYALFKEKGLDYGSSFQGIETLYYSKEEALSRIHLPAQEGYVLTPGVLDSALQTCAGLSFSGSEQNLALPFSLAELNIYNNLPEALWCHVRRSSSSSGNIMHYNIELLNDEGAVLVQIKEFTLLPIDRLKQHGQENSRTYLYQSLWKEAAVKTTDKADRKQMILIAGGSADLADKLQEELEAEVRAIGAATPEAYLLAVLDEVKKRAQQKAPAHIIVVHQNSEQADYAFASGLLKTVAQEHSFLSGKVLGVEQLSMQHLDELVPLLQTEQHTADAEVRYRSGRREVKTLEEISHINSSTPSSIREGGIYLVTGGAGGLGMILAEHMGRTKDAHVILTGRSELSQQKSQAIAHLNASYYRCDVTSREDVINLMTTIKERHGHLNGIIHSAGVLRDSLLLNKTAEEVQAVVAPKITGWKNLDEATRDEALDFVVLFSSLSSIMGNAGQADYAAANSWLDNYALYRNELVAQGRRSGRTLSINWPLWKDGGMQISEDTQDYLTRQFGLSPLPTQEGIAAFETFLDSTISQGIVLHGKDIRIANKVHREAAPLHDNKPTGNTTELKEKASGKIRELIAELLKLGVSDIETDAELGDYGFDSVLLTKFANSLNEYYDLDIKPTAFYNYTTIEQLAGFLAEDHYEQLAKRHGSTTQEQSALTEAASVQAQPVQKQRTRFMRASQPARQSSSNEPIAIIGISGRFPGSPDLPTFWNNLKENKDLITEVPADRWDWKKYYGDPLTEKNKTKAKWGGFIQDIDKFDPLFFSISPLEAELMDPQQRITLQAVYEAIEDAALSADHIKGSATGIFIGVSASDYTLLVHRHTDLTGEAQFSTGAAHSMLVNRISYLLDLHGPSEPIDTACSSSLVAIHRAVESIRNGHCSMAIAGGVNALLAPDATLSFSQAGMLSEEGRCCTFDQSASGYVRGEGVGVIVLKPLSQAEADGDPIYAVIRSTAENHGGKANTLTSPNPQAQKELLLKAYRSGGVDPRHVGYIEAHGTGTPLGDPIETEGLKLAFKELYRERGLEMPSEPYCALGSVKTNIGHLESAAGVAGVMKVLLGMRHGLLPGNPHLKNPNAYLQLDGTPFYLQRETTPWNTIDGHRRIAGVSSFGFGGANAHVVMEEYRGAAKEVYRSEDPAIIVLSARDGERLKQQAVNLKNYLASHPDAHLHDIAYTLQVGRAAMEERVALVVQNREELLQYLDHYVQGQSPAGLFRGNIRKEKTDFVLESEAGKGYIERAIQCREARSVAQLWVKGVSIDWNLLYPHQRPSKLRLPVYPFAGERYWISIQKEEVPASNSRLHPLLHFNESDLSGQKFLSVFSGTEPFFEDHKVRSVKVLPGAAQLELAREAGERSLHRKITCLKEVVFLSPIQAFDSPRKLNIRLHPAGEEIDFVLYDNDQGSGAVFSRGRMNSRSLPHPPTRDLSSIRQRLVKRIGKEEYYDLLKLQGIIYGKSFQGIQSILHNEEEVLSQISLTRQEDYTLPPDLLDSAVQTVMGLSFSFNQNNPLVLPFSVREVNIYNPLPSTFWSYARKNSREPGMVATYDVDLLDDSGEVLLSFRDFLPLPVDGEAKRRQQASSPAKEANGMNPQVLYAPVWNRIKINGVLAGGGGKHLVVTGRGSIQLAAQLKRILEERNERVEEVKDLDPSASGISDLYLLQGLTAPDEQNPSGEQYELHELHVFRTIKALLSSDYRERELNITVLTSGTQKVHAGDRVTEKGSGIPGLIGSLVKEQPSWNVRVIDLEGMMCNDSAIRKVLSVPFDREGAVMAFRKGCVYAKSLCPLEQASGKLSRLRKGGTYVILGGAGGIGKVTTEHLIREYGARVIWLGRRPLNSEIERSLDEMEKLGVRPMYISCNAVNKASLQEAYRAIKKSHGTVNGLFHSAIVLHDKLLVNMSEDDFRRSFDPKSLASHYLAEAFRDEPLDFICFYSSIQSHFNAAGQANYSAGCTYKDSLAHSLRTSHNIPTHIINWGYWGDVGVVSSGDYRERMKSMGVASISSGEGMDILETVLSNGLDQVAAIKFI
jgi:polyketide synthase PksN